MAGCVHDLVLGLLCTRTGQDSILVMVDNFLKMSNFISYKKTEDATLVAHLFFQEVVHLHSIPKIITSISDVKFISKSTSSLNNDPMILFLGYIYTTKCVLPIKVWIIPYKSSISLVLYRYRICLGYYIILI